MTIVPAEAVYIGGGLGIVVILLIVLLVILIVNAAR